MVDINNNSKEPIQIQQHANFSKTTGFQHMKAEQDASYQLAGGSQTQDGSFLANSQFATAAAKQVSPLQDNVQRLYEAQQADPSVFTVNQVIATSGEVQRMGAHANPHQPQIMGAGPKKQSRSKGHFSNVYNNPQPQHAYQDTAKLMKQQQKQDQNLVFQQQPQQEYYNLPTQVFHPQAYGQQGPQPPQVHFIAKQQKFYQISPSRANQDFAQQLQMQQQAAAASVPFLVDARRPYTSSSVQQVMNKRQSGNKVQNQQIAALYLPQNQQKMALTQPSSSSQPPVAAKPHSSNNTAGNTIQSQATPYQPPKKRLIQNLSVPRPGGHNKTTLTGQQPVFTQIDHEQLFEEAIKLKHLCQETKDDNSRLRAKLKMLEQELQRKDKAIEDFYQQDRFIQNAQSKQAVSGQLAPIAQQTQKYQQETFLLMSLKKQVKQLKAENSKKDDYVAQLVKLGGKQGKYLEMQQELDYQRQECEQLKTLLSTAAHEHHQQDQMYQDLDSSKQLASAASQEPHLQPSESNQAHLVNQGHMRNQSSTSVVNTADLQAQMEQKDAEIDYLSSQLQHLSQQMQQQLQQIPEQPPSQDPTLKTDLQKAKTLQKETHQHLQEKEKQLKQQATIQQKLEAQLKQSEKAVLTKTQLLKEREENFMKKLQEKDTALQQMEKKNKSLKETISKVSGKSESQQSLKGLPAPKAVQEELAFVAPVLGTNQKIYDRLALAQELKLGVGMYTPSQAVHSYLQTAQVHEVALLFPQSLVLKKCILDDFTGQVGQRVLEDFSGKSLKSQGQELTLQQRQYLCGRYLVAIEQDNQIYLNTQQMQQEMSAKDGGAVPRQKKSSVSSAASHKQHVDEEQMLDIAEVCFVRMADILIKQGVTVREAFAKYSIPEMLPESKTVLELLVPEAFFEACRVELKIKEFSDLEAACLMRVLAKPELENSVILNEFALIMENFGVPLLDGTISDEEEFIAEGQEKPFQYDLKRIDEEGIQLLEQVAKFLLKEYMHPREFFGKMVKNNHEVKGKKENGDEKVFKVDVLAIKDFYLKVKIANIKKTLAENESLNKELCLDPVVHPTFFNMKTFVRALEDIAEVEQEKLFDLERIEEQKMLDQQEQERAKREQDEQPTEESKDKVTLSSALVSSPLQSSPKSDSPPRKSSDYNNSDKSEVVRFGKGSRSRRSPKPQSKFQALGTIDEAVNETATSQMVDQSVRDDESKVGSNNLRSSNQIDFEQSESADKKDSMVRVDLLNRSLSGRAASDQLHEKGTSKLLHKGDPSTENLYDENFKYALDDSAGKDHSDYSSKNSDTDQHKDIDNVALEVHDQGCCDDYEDDTLREQ